MKELMKEKGRDEFGRWGDGKGMRYTRWGSLGNGSVGIPCVLLSTAPRVSLLRCLTIRLQPRYQHVHVTTTLFKSAFRQCL